MLGALGPDARGHSVHGYSSPNRSCLCARSRLLDRVSPKPSRRLHAAVCRHRSLDPLRLEFLLGLLAELSLGAEPMQRHDDRNQPGRANRAEPRRRLQDPLGEHR